MEKILLINKPIDWTSNDVVQKIKNTFKYKKVGHAGTLDPNATGLLIIGYDESTKQLSKLIIDDKQYIAKIKFGIETNSGDITGTITNKKETELDINDIKNKCDSFLDNYYQTPHAYSAIKINGKKAYEYARKNIDVKIEPRLVKIYHYDLINFDSINQELIIKIDVSKGFYVRSFAVDLAKKLNTYATIISLERTKCGKYQLIDAIELDQLIKGKNDSNKRN